jgi:hypothetical protein
MMATVCADAESLREARVQLVRSVELAWVLFDANPRAPQPRRGCEHDERLFAEDVGVEISQARVHDLAAGQSRRRAHSLSVVVEHDC